MRVLVTKLERAFEEKDAAATASLAGCPFSVGQPESDSLSDVPSIVFAERFLRAVKELDLTLNEGSVSSAYLREPRRIFLWVDSGKERATLFVDRQPKADFRHRHIFSFERDVDGWRFTDYATPDGGLLERLRRGYPAILV